MASTFALLRSACGLSLTEAAAFLDARPDTIKAWNSGRRNAPDSVIDELRSLYRMIADGAAEALETIEPIIEAQDGPGEIELGIASDDHEAQGLGFPCVGAHGAMLAIVAAELDVPIRVVPRGSTPATAAAADKEDQA